MSNSPYPYKIPFSNYKLVGIRGRAGTGKTSLKKAFEKHLPKQTIGLSFAQPLKFACAELFDVGSGVFFDAELKEIVMPKWGITPRQALQFIGTEVCREFLQKLLPDIGENFWIKRLHSVIEFNYLYKDSMEITTPIFIIDDVRFQNEVEFISQNDGYLIHLTRPEGAPDVVGISNHVSENTALDLSNTNYTHYANTTLENLDQFAKEFAAQFLSC